MSLSSNRISTTTLLVAFILIILLNGVSSTPRPLTFEWGPIPLNATIVPQRELSVSRVSTRFSTLTLRTLYATSVVSINTTSGATCCLVDVMNYDALAFGSMIAFSGGRNKESPLFLKNVATCANRTIQQDLLYEVTAVAASDHYVVVHAAPPLIDQYVAVGIMDSSLVVARSPNNTAPINGTAATDLLFVGLQNLQEIKGIPTTSSNTKFAVFGDSWIAMLGTHVMPPSQVEHVEGGASPTTKFGMGWWSLPALMQAANDAKKNGPPTNNATIFSFTYTGFPEYFIEMPVGSELNMNVQFVEPQVKDNFEVAVSLLGRGLPDRSYVIPSPAGANNRMCRTPAYIPIANTYNRGDVGGYICVFESSPQTAQHLICHDARASVLTANEGHELPTVLSGKINYPVTDVIGLTLVLEPDPTLILAVLGPQPKDNEAAGQSTILAFDVGEDSGSNSVSKEQEFLVPKWKKTFMNVNRDLQSPGIPVSTGRQFYVGLSLNASLISLDGDGTNLGMGTMSSSGGDDDDLSSESPVVAIIPWETTKATTGVFALDGAANIYKLDSTFTFTIPPTSTKTFSESMSLLQFTEGETSLCTQQTPTQPVRLKIDVNNKNSPGVVNIFVVISNNNEANGGQRGNLNLDHVGDQDDGEGSSSSSPSNVVQQFSYVGYLEVGPTAVVPRPYNDPTPQKLMCLTDPSFALLWQHIGQFFGKLVLESLCFEPGHLWTRGTFRSADQQIKLTQTCPYMAPRCTMPTVDLKTVHHVSPLFRPFGHHSPLFESEMDTLSFHPTRRLWQEGYVPEGQCTSISSIVSSNINSNENIATQACKNAASCLVDDCQGVMSLMFQYYWCFLSFGVSPTPSQLFSLVTPALGVLPDYNDEKSECEALIHGVINVQEFMSNWKFVTFQDSTVGNKSVTILTNCERGRKELQELGNLSFKLVAWVNDELATNSSHRDPLPQGYAVAQSSGLNISLTPCVDYGFDDYHAMPYTLIFIGNIFSVLLTVGVNLLVERVPFVRRWIIRCKVALIIAIFPSEFTRGDFYNIESVTRARQRFRKDLNHFYTSRVQKKRAEFEDDFGKIWIALIPQLKEKDIRPTQELQRVCDDYFWETFTKCGTRIHAPDIRPRKGSTNRGGGRTRHSSMPPTGHISSKPPADTNFERVLEVFIQLAEDHMEGKRHDSGESMVFKALAISDSLKRFAVENVMKISPRGNQRPPLSAQDLEEAEEFVHPDGHVTRQQEREYSDTDDDGEDCSDGNHCQHEEEDDEESSSGSPERTRSSSGGWCKSQYPYGSSPLRHPGLSNVRKRTNTQQSHIHDDHDVMSGVALPSGSESQQRLLGDHHQRSSLNEDSFDMVHHGRDLDPGRRRAESLMSTGEATMSMLNWRLQQVNFVGGIYLQHDWENKMLFSSEAWVLFIEASLVTLYFFFLIVRVFLKCSGSGTNGNKFTNSETCHHWGIYQTIFFHFVNGGLPTSFLISTFMRGFVTHWSKISIVFASFGCLLFAAPFFTHMVAGYFKFTVTTLPATILVVLPILYLRQIVRLPSMASHKCRALFSKSLYRFLFFSAYDEHHKRVLRRQNSAKSSPYNGSAVSLPSPTGSSGAPLEGFSERSARDYGSIQDERDGGVNNSTGSGVRRTGFSSFNNKQHCQETTEQLPEMKRPSSSSANHLQEETASSASFTIVTDAPAAPPSSKSSFASHFSVYEMVDDEKDSTAREVWRFVTKVIFRIYLTFAITVLIQISFNYALLGIYRGAVPEFGYFEILRFDFTARRVACSIFTLTEEWTSSKAQVLTTLFSV